MQKMTNKEFIKIIKEDLEKRSKKDKNNAGIFENFSILEDNIDEIGQSFFDDEGTNSLENSNNIYVECKINRKEAIDGCSKNIKINRGVNGKIEETRIKIQIPKNIQNGNKILIHGEGNRDEKNKGNLVVAVIIK